MPAPPWLPQNFRAHFLLVVVNCFFSKQPAICNYNCFSVHLVKRGCFEEYQNYLKQLFQYKMPSRNKSHLPVSAYLKFGCELDEWFRFTTTGKAEKNTSEQQMQVVIIWASRSLCMRPHTMPLKIVYILPGIEGLSSQIQAISHNDIWVLST